MKDFTFHNYELNELVNFIKTTINRPHSDRTNVDFRVCVEYREDDILVYPADGDSMLLVDEIMAKVTDLDLNAILNVRYRRYTYLPTLLIY